MLRASSRKHAHGSLASGSGRSILRRIGPLKFGQVQTALADAQAANALQKRNLLCVERKLLKARKVADEIPVVDGTGNAPGGMGVADGTDVQGGMGDEDGMGGTDVQGGMVDGGDGTDVQGGMGDVQGGMGDAEGMVDGGDGTDVHGGMGGTDAEGGMVDGGDDSDSSSMEEEVPLLCD